MKKPILAIVAALAAAFAIGLVPPGHAVAATTSTLVNFNSSGQQVVRFDTNGNAVDAHDGQLARFGDTYYLYGTSYDCGYRWQVNSSFCGFKVYSSPDLVNWTDRGFVVQPYQCGDCFRPHVIYDPATGKYVLWTNDSSTAPGDFRVYTSNARPGRSPSRPCRRWPTATAAGTSGCTRTRSAAAATWSTPTARTAPRAWSCSSSARTTCPPTGTTR